jgi:hypothetical protein
MQRLKSVPFKFVLAVAVCAAALVLGGHAAPADAMFAIGAAGYIDAVTVGANFSGKAYAGGDNGEGRTTPPIPQFAVHRFFVTPDNQLGHEMDGMLRATVPPEGWSDYVAHWPDANAVVSQLKSAGEAKMQAAAAAKAELEAKLRAELTAQITAEVMAQVKAQGNG